MNRRIKKVKYDGAKVVIHYEVERANEAIDEYTLSCVDAPTAEFKAAMNALKDVLPNWIDVHPDWAATCEVRGAFFSHKNGIFGGGFTALKPLKNCNSPLVINAPHKPSEPYSEGGDESVCLTAIESELLCEVCRQAELYLDGERAQMELPLEGGVTEVTFTGAGKTVTLNADTIKSIDRMRETTGEKKTMKKQKIYTIAMDVARRVIRNGRDMYGMSTSWIAETCDTVKYEISCSDYEVAVRLAKEHIIKTWGDIIQIGIVSVSQDKEIYVSEILEGVES
jgi:hypothetical protein